MSDSQESSWMDVFRPLDRQLFELAMIIGFLSFPVGLVSVYLYGIEDGGFIFLVLAGISTILNQVSAMMNT